MFRSTQLFLLLILLFLLPVFPVLMLAGQPARSMADLRAGLQDAPDDTAKVKLLFDMGNRFMDGPSDSLTYYYEKALNLINERLLFYNSDSATNREMIKVYRRFEMRAWIELGIEYFFRSDYDDALASYFKALAIAKELNDKEVLSECHSEVAIVYKNQGNYDLALEHNEKALALSRFLNDSSWTAACYANQGTIYLKKGYFTLALNNYLTALKTFEALDQKRRMGACYLNVGKVYAGQKDFSQALKYYSLALRNGRQTGNNMNVADSYLSMGEALLNQGQPSVARIYLDSALLVFNRTGYTHGMDDCYTFIGHTCKLRHNYDEAKSYYARSLELSTRENDLPGMAESLINLAEIEYLEHHIAKALTFAKRSLKLAGETGNLKSLEATWQVLSKIYEAGGNNKKALNAYKMYNNYKDTLFNESKYRSIREAEARFESEKKEQQLVLLAGQNEVQELKLGRRRNLLFASGAGIVLILLVSYLFIRQNRISSKQKAIELEQRLLRSQMNPHFIFNSLIAIQSYIYKSEAVEAGDFLAKFADLIRYTLEHSRVEFVLLADELKMLTAYLDLQVLRFDNKFEYSLTVGSNLDTESLEIPPMFAQPFVENAIEHGLRYKQSPGRLEISYETKGNRLFTITVKDDGVGRAKAAEIEKKKQHRSRAVGITRERLSILSKRYRQKFTFSVTDLKDGEGNPAGTEVKVVLPFQIAEKY